MASTTSEREKRYRPTPREYWKRYGELAERDGEKCAECGRKPPETKLEIDHRDGRINTWNKENQRLLCKSCNVKNQRVKVPSVKVRERESDSVEPESESEVRRAKFPAFRLAILKRLLESTEELRWNYAQYTLSQVIGVASNTADRWLRELCKPYNMNGPFKSSWKNLGKGPRYKVLELSEDYGEKA